ncbi:hypothetical protein F511_12139 [Dorcoceras hygrometricum]|uniref:Uncharacterized protein n=1 Tax=Dorcoceras hygrometricum TaxID=472368 RepID=A0A2Z7C652_9LAMI|nr:hypothetical protein F511_12139 [Dorcoceras hygrometricum]
MSSLDDSVVRRVAESLDSPSSSGSRNEGDGTLIAVDIPRARLVRIAREGAEHASSRNFSQTFQSPPVNLYLDAVNPSQEDLVWNGKALNHLTRAHDEVILTRHSMDGVLNRHDQLIKKFEELHGHKDEEKQQQLLELEATQAQRQALGSTGCLAQFRDNGYSEEENPAAFLGMMHALEDMPEVGEVVREDSSGPEASTPS